VTFDRFRYHFRAEKALSARSNDPDEDSEGTTDPLVSIIIAAYNAAPFINRALSSAREQTLKNIEVIIVDDGSFDDTAEIAERFCTEDQRFRLIRLSVNSGVSHARNVGLDSAIGRWVAILDADDRFLPERLERLLVIAEATLCDIVIDDLTLVFPADQGTRLAFTASRMSNPNSISTERFVSYDRPRLGLNAVGFSKPLIRRKFIDGVALRYSTGISIGEDFHFYVQALLRGADMRFTEYSGYIYNVNEGSLSRLNLQKVRESISQSSSMLITESKEFRNQLAVKALQRREFDIDAANDLTDILQRWSRRDLITAGLVFARSRVKAGVVYRLTAKIRYDVLAKFGIRL